MARGHSDAARGPLRAIFGDGTVAGMTDGQLLRRFAAGRDEATEVAFAAIVRRHGPMVLGVGRRLLGDPHAAEDAFQATFLVLARRAGSLRDPERLGPWLYGVAVRTAREARARGERIRRREGRGVVQPRPEPASEAATPEREALGREAAAALHEEVAGLPERYRDPVVLCHLEGLTHEEAARKLGCPPRQWACA